MSNTTIVAEELTKAEQGAQMVAQDLRAALAAAAPVEAIVLMDLIRRAQELKTGIEQLRLARLASA